jgi:hypothetical protein
MVSFFEAPGRFATLYASRTNTEKPAGTLLPVSRGYRKPMLQRKTRHRDAAFFTIRVRPASF